MGSAFGGGTPAESTSAYTADGGLAGACAVDGSDSVISDGKDDGSAASRLALLLPAYPDRLRGLRRKVGHFLCTHGVSDGDLFDLLVAVSEAVANAIEHPIRPAEPLIRVVVEIHGDVVDVMIRDSGSWRQQARSAGRGRGLMLISALADLDVRHEAHGTTVMLRRRLTHSAKSSGY